MDNLNENGLGTADAAGAEKEIAAAVPEKFESVETLAKAYTALEAEFTRRSQRLKELEKENKALKAPDGENTALSPEDFVSKAASDERVKNAVLGEYLKSVSLSRTVPLVTGGSAVTAPRTVPKTVREAGMLAKEFLKE